MTDSVTREEAITYLEWMKDLAEDLETPEQKDMMLKTINKAIEALGQGSVLDKIRSEIKEQIDYHDNEHRKYDSEEEFGISLGLELALAMINKEIKPQESNERR